MDENNTAAYTQNIERVVTQLSAANKVMVLSGAGMSTVAGIPDFRSAGGLYGNSQLLAKAFTYLKDASKSEEWQREMIAHDVKSALLHSFFKVNPLPYHEMRRGMIIGLGEQQWKPTIGHVFPAILERNKKLHMLASQNIDGLDHMVIADKRKLYNPHGLMSVLVCEPLYMPLCTSPEDPIYKKYVELVKENVKDIYADRPARNGKSSHLWQGPKDSTPITLEMFGEVLPEEFRKAAEMEKQRREYSVKPGSVLFDRKLWDTNAAGEPYDAFSDVNSCDMLLIMGTSLSGLTIDNLAHIAGHLDIPRVVFDMTEAPVKSIRSKGRWAEQQDSFLQGSIDDSILDVLQRMGWLEQLLDYLQYLCLGSLKKLKQFLLQHSTSGETPANVEKVEETIKAEIEREKRFYGDE